MSILNQAFTETHGKNFVSDVYECYRHEGMCVNKMLECIFCCEETAECMLNTTTEHPILKPIKAKVV